MARPVYSRPFIRTKGLHGDGDLITVPDGYYYVVRTVTMYCNAGADTIQCALKHASVDSVLLFKQWLPGDRTGVVFDVHIAFTNDESFRFSVGTLAGGGVDVFAGGYQLLAP